MAAFTISSSSLLLYIVLFVFLVEIRLPTSAEGSLSVLGILKQNQFRRKSTGSVKRERTVLLP